LRQLRQHVSRLPPPTPRRCRASSSRKHNQRASYRYQSVQRLLRLTGALPAGAEEGRYTLGQANYRHYRRVQLSPFWRLFIQVSLSPRSVTHSYAKRISLAVLVAWQWQADTHFVDTLRVVTGLPRLYGYCPVHFLLLPARFRGAALRTTVVRLLQDGISPSRPPTPHAHYLWAEGRVHATSAHAAGCTQHLPSTLPACLCHLDSYRPATCCHLPGPPTYACPFYLHYFTCLLSFLCARGTRFLLVCLPDGRTRLYGAFGHYIHSPVLYKGRADGTAHATSRLTSRI